jgi:hypothetical protein
LHGECAVRDTFGLCDGRVWYKRTAHRTAEPSIANQTQEKWLVKASAIAFAMSAMLAGPVLAQGTSSSSDTHIRGALQGRTNLQGGTSGSGDEQFNAHAGVPVDTAGVAKPGVRSPVAAGSGARGAIGNPVAAGKR